MRSPSANPSLLLVGLRLKKTLQVYAPQEYEALRSSLEKLLASASLELPPKEKETIALTELLMAHKPSGSIRELALIDEALEGFFDALFLFSKGRPDISALCCEIVLYRSHLNPPRT